MARSPAAGGLGAFAYGIGLAGVAIALLVYVTAKIKTTLGSNSSDVNTTFDNTITASKDISTWFGILVVVGMSTLALGFFAANKLRV